MANRTTDQRGKSRRRRIAAAIVQPALILASLASGCSTAPSLWRTRSSAARLREGQVEPPRRLGHRVRIDPGVGRASVAPSSDSTRPDTAPAIPAPAGEYPIDLSTALRLAEVENPLIAEARQRVGEALALQRKARALLFPDLNVGGNLHDHTGNLQRSSGTILRLNETSLYFGGGAGALAASTIEVPAVNISSPLTDALFEPLAARQAVEASRFRARTTANNILLEVAELHFELLAAEAELQVRRLSAEQEAEVARLAQAYANAQQGRAADAERAATELRLIEREVKQAEENVAVASVRLARRLHLDQAVRLRSIAPTMEMITLIDPASGLPDLIQVALNGRPEIAAANAAISAAEFKHQEERFRPLLPTLWLGFSGGAFGGGSDLVGSQLGNFAGRTDFDVMAYWTAQNLGLGNLSLIKQRWAEVGQAVASRSLAIADVRSGVAEAYAGVLSARGRAALAERRVASAEAGFREDLERIRNTVGRPIEVVNSLELLNTARVARIRAVMEYNQSEFRLFVSLGAPPPLGEPANGPIAPAPVASPPLPPLAAAAEAVRR